MVSAWSDSLTVNIGDDVTPPEVAIIEPAEGESIAGVTTIRARATDDTKVARVEFLVDAVCIGIDSSPVGNVFEFMWAGIMRPGSAHSLSCSAVDAAGNRGTSPAVNVFVSSSAGTHHSGTIATAENWTAADNPHIIDSDLDIEASLTVEPGVVVLVADGASIAVGAHLPSALIAGGRSDSLTVFVPLSDPPGPGLWRGIEFWEQTDPIRTRLNYCSIEGAGAGNTAAITCYAEVLIANTKIANNAGTGIYCQNAGFARFENDTVTGCGGFPLHIAAQHVGTIGNGNSFTGNAHDAIEVAGGTIAGNAQYRWQGVPYRILETVEVGSALEPTLLIENGVELQFEPGAGLAIGRTARASLQADSVTLTGTTAQPGAWNGLELHRYTTSDSRVERCRLLYGGGASFGIVFIDSCIPVLAGNEIAFSSNYCVFMQNTDLDPDSVRSKNWLHDWDPSFEDIYDAP
jgi:hypothetical protein